MSPIKQLTLQNGLKMPLVGLGLWQADDPKEFEDAVDAALTAGYRHFDTATLYENEDKLGNVLKKWLDSGKIKREELFIVTKLPWNAMHADRVEQFTKSSLRRLQLDYIDLYLMHWPIALQYTTEEDLTPKDSSGNILYDCTTDLESIWKAMEKQVQSGRAKSIGISNFNEKQIERIAKVATIIPANHQVEVHVHFQNRKIREASRKHNITVCAYGPLGSPGREGAAFTMKFVVPNLLKDPVIMDIAAKHNKSTGQVLLRYLVQQDIAVIPKSTNPARIRQNMDIFNFSLTAEDMKRIDALDRGEAGRSFPGFPDMQKHPETPW